MNTKSQALRCGIISKGWPTWGLAACKRNLEVKIMLVSSDAWYNQVRSLFPDTRVVDLNMKDICEQLVCDTPANLWLSDVEPPRRLGLFTRFSSAIVITRRRVRYDVTLTHGYHFRRLAHANCGGVTDSSWDLHIYLPRGISMGEPIAQRAGRDLCVIVDSKLGGVPCPPPVKLKTAVRPDVISLRPGTYHAGGLYPISKGPCRLIVPSVFSPTGWVRRKLSGKELCAAQDIAEEQFDKLSSKEIAELCQGEVFPLKVALVALDDVVLRKTLTWASEPVDKRTRCEQDSEANNQRKVEDVPIAFSDPAGNVEGERKWKATKADDAQVPEYLWDMQLVPCGDPHKIEKVSILRNFALRWVKRHTTRSFLSWFFGKHVGATRWCRHERGVSYIEWSTALHDYLNSHKEGRLNWEAGGECVARFADSSWWEWGSGSRPHFWRWPEEYRERIRDGVPPWFKTRVPRWQVPQRAERDEIKREKMKAKLEKVRCLGYIRPGRVDSLTSYFSVPKGDSDIRMVYDGTKSGLNDSLWAPWFSLPTVESLLRSVGPETYMGDIDIGDMFHNFMLHEGVQKVAGIDITPFFLEELNHRRDVRMIWERWVRCAMGLKCSPYNTIQGALFMDEIIRGNPKDPANPFRWSTVRLNLPGSPDYQPHLAWVSVIREDGRVACDFISYVDDTRTCGNSRSEARGVSRAVASKMNWLGIQEAARKRRDPCQDPGPWAGSVVHVSVNGVITVSVTQDRWNKVREIIAWIEAEISKGDEIDFKMLERFRGFLVYVSRTYPTMVPYLKGIHLSLDSWRPWRGSDGWKMTQAQITLALNEGSLDSLVGNYVADRKAPERVKWAPRLRQDVDALLHLTNSETPPHRIVRPQKGSTAVYSFGDASGSGFGSSFLREEQVSFYSGQWTEELSANSSNYRELSNLINAIEQAHADGSLNDSEVFIFTDNTAAESTFFKGTSSSKTLFELILKLQNMQMNSRTMIHFVHVAGRRMIRQGTDGLSRGLVSEGVLGGEDFLSFVPLHQSAWERGAVLLEEWVTSWLGVGGTPRWLFPEDWFGCGHTEDLSVWTPPPTAADAALEQLAKAVHKRPLLTRVVLIPRLMTARWRKMLNKICDLVFNVPLGSDVWSNVQCEPLVVGISFPLCRHAPWRLKGSAHLVGVERELRSLQPTDFRRSRLILRELLQQTRSLDGMPASMVRRMLQTT